ncbi:MAG: hypothetical protein WCO02_02065 [Bacteroidota bacterium]
MITKGIKFIIILFLIDMTLGTTARFIFFTQKSGKFYRISYLFNKADGDVFIFGSSRSSHHYNPGILDKCLAINSFNVGAQGQQILYQSTIQKILLKNRKPKLLILDINPDWLYKSQDAYDNLRELRPFWFKFPEVIGPTLTLQSKLQKIWLFSRSYQYNSTIVHILYYMIKPQKDQKGYVPLLHKMKPDEYSFQRGIDSIKFIHPKELEFDPIFENSFRNFLTLAMSRNIAVIMVCSPDILYKEIEYNQSKERILQISKSYGIPFLDFSEDPYFLTHHEFFNDTHHLNDLGAKIFSRRLCERLRPYL